MDGFEEQLLNDLQLKIIVGNRQPKDNGKEKKKIDGFVLSSNLGFPENNSTDIFHPNSNPRTVQISEKIFDHNPICLKIGEAKYRPFWSDSYSHNTQKVEVHEPMETSSHQV